MDLHGTRNPEETIAGSRDDKALEDGGEVADGAGRGGAALPCSELGCATAFAAVLQQRALCLDHFLDRVYTMLEQLDGHRDQSGRIPATSLGQARGLLDECSIQALTVSMSSSRLSNLERGRLLDVLLWASELSEALRPPANFGEARDQQGAGESAGSSAASS